MSLVHIIGNGFDINAGLNTRYSDFYEYYSKVGSDRIFIPDDLLESELPTTVTLKLQPKSVKKFKEDMYNDLETWSDLETALGQYCHKIKSPVHFNEIFEDISDYLKEFLELAESEISNISFPKSARKELKKCLLKPERFADSSWAKSVKQKRVLSDISIINFNYTNTIQMLLPSEDLNVLHVHGSLKDEIVIGVNQPDQINNDEFRKNLDVTEALVKPTTRALVNKPIVDQCNQVIENATLISIFGSSLGTTDQYWWDLIAKRLESGKLKVLVFWRPSEEDSNRLYKKPRIERNVKALFKSQNSVDMKLVDSNVAIITDSRMFDVFRR